MFALKRTDNGPDSTAGLLFSPDGTTLCATLERAWLNNERGKSRIPPGTYPLRLKKIGESRFDEHYKKQFGALHQGMIEIDKVLGRDEILIHLANWSHQLEGCIAVGARTTPHGKGNFQIPPGESRDGYLIAYPLLLKAAQSGSGKIIVTDPERIEPLIA